MGVQAMAGDDRLSCFLFYRPDASGL